MFRARGLEHRGLVSRSGGLEGLGLRAAGQALQGLGFEVKGFLLAARGCQWGQSIYLLGDVQIFWCVS